MIAGLEILNLHAQGGMAEVYRARGKGADGKTWLYAVKRILPEYTADPELRKMFVEEARIASLLVHPNVVRVYDLARSENDEYFIVMEFLEGRDLAEAIDRANELSRGLPVWLAIHCAREVLSALIYATTQARDRQGNLLGMIHRDISPHNIFVCFDGQVKLTDFGVAKVEQSNVLTQVGVTKGKFGYMSPEQLSSSGLDFRSDLYNVGILLYEVMSCRRLFWGDNPSQFLQSMIKAEVPPIDPVVRAPPELEALMRRALSRDRESRPTSAAAFDMELAAIQQRYALTVTRAHLEAEWRGLFGAEPAVAPPAEVASALPKHLASVSAAMPSVVARAEVPHVHQRPAFAQPTQAPVAVTTVPPTVNVARPSGTSSDEFTHEATLEEERERLARAGSTRRRKQSTKELEAPPARPVSPSRPRVQTKSVRALPSLPSGEPETVPPDGEPPQGVRLGAEVDTADVTTDPLRGPQKRSTVAKGAGPNAVMLSVDDNWEGGATASDELAHRPSSGKSVVTRSQRVVPLNKPKR